MSGLAKHCKETGFIFTITTNDEKCRSEIKEIMPDFKQWAWIDHVPDSDEGKEHTHFIFKMNGTRTVQQVADRCNISPQYVQVVRKITSFYLYMLHRTPQAIKDGKKPYELDDIHTNHIDDFRELVEGKTRDVSSLFNQFIKLRVGVITPQEFIDKNFIDFNRMAFSQKIKTFEIITKNYGGGHVT